MPSSVCTHRVCVCKGVNVCGCVCCVLCMCAVCVCVCACVLCVLRVCVCVCVCVYAHDARTLRGFRSGATAARRRARRRDARAPLAAARRARLTTEFEHRTAECGPKRCSVLQWWPRVRRRGRRRARPRLTIFLASRARAVRVGANGLRP